MSWLLSDRSSANNLTLTWTYGSLISVWSGCNLSLVSYWHYPLGLRDNWGAVYEIFFSFAGVIVMVNQTVKPKNLGVKPPKFAGEIMLWWWRFLGDRRITSKPLMPFRKLWGHNFTRPPWSRLNTGFNTG